MNHLSASHLAAVLDGDVSGNNVSAPGPNNIDRRRDRSMSITVDPDAPDGFLVKSHSPKNTDMECKEYIRAKLGLPEWKPNGHGPKPVQRPEPKPTVVCHYEYQDETGEPYLRVTRLSNKKFTQSHWDGIDGWLSKAPVGPRYPYRLPDILANPQATIWLVEGEKDADRLASLGLIATTAPGGAEALNGDVAKWLDGQPVVALPDNDTAGRKWADRVASLLPDAVIVHLPGLPVAGDVSDWLNSGGDVAGLLALAANPPPDIQGVIGPDPADAPSPFTPTPYVWQDPTTIPRREWLYGRHLIRRYVSTTISPGGLGKSSLVLVEALAMVSHKPLLEERIHLTEPLRVWYWNGEDPNDEAARRIQAAAIQHGLNSDDIGDRLFVDSGREMRLKLASMVRGEITLDEKLFDEITAGLIERRVDVWTLDPFISAHQVSENDNGAIDAVIKRLGIVAERANCAIELVHHVRKPANADAVTDVNDARGASALIGGVRSARVLNAMTKDIAEAAKIDPRERHSYFSVTNGKSNMGPRSDVGLWRQIKSVDLNNGGMALDSSDHVGVVVPYQLPDAMALIPPNAADIAQDVARVNDMTRYSHKSPDWFGNFVGPALGVNIAEKGGQALLRVLIDKWLENGILAKRMGEDARRNKREFICLPADADPYAASVSITQEEDESDLPF